MKAIQQRSSILCCCLSLRETFVSSSRVGRGVHSLTLSNPAFPLPTTALPILQGSLKDGFGEAVVARDLPELGCRAA